MIFANIEAVGRLRKRSSIENREAKERGMVEVLPPCLLKRGKTRAEVLFYNNIIGNFMVYQFRIETNLLQLFAHRENSDVLYDSVIIFKVNIVAKQKQA